ncbi:DUF1128 domain-containing protein [Alteribacter keqinensis]|uniref:UPF0435 protein EBO34_06720 n=2 Tax=Alteribacter TaxID=2823237 RepID=A0A3M7TYF0_9BACI|nr:MULTISPECIES: DUF1128 domain-containing protein [Alteribacter]MBM7094141.1 DUF1128 domain-containing protein [Alteribacter salitolerans]RNA70616.1 DUF1128 domain-containing protein [Alteribacter keqinensis]
MNLDQKTEENINIMLDEIKQKLQIVNAGAIKAEAFDLNKYDDLKDIHAYVMSKDNFSVNEMDGIVSELGQMRK